MRCGTTVNSSWRKLRLPGIAEESPSVRLALAAKVLPLSFGREAKGMAATRALDTLVCFVADECGGALRKPPFMANCTRLRRRSFRRTLNQSRRLNSVGFNQPQLRLPGRAAGFRL